MVTETRTYIFIESQENLIILNRAGFGINPTPPGFTTSNGNIFYTDIIQYIGRAERSVFFCTSRDSRNTFLDNKLFLTIVGIEI